VTAGLSPCSAADDRSSGPAHRARPRLVLATRNPHKRREIAAIYDDLEADIETLDAWPEIGDLPEGGASYAENAASKALAVARATGLVALADDSGLEIDALGRQPGLRSRRLLGDAATDADRNAHVLALLAHVPEERRSARFQAVVAVAAPDGIVRMFSGTCEGSIAVAPRGQSGFGYDPIFAVAGDGRTMAELPLSEKNRISHRGRALRAAEGYLERLLRAGGEERRASGANNMDVPAAPAAGGASRPVERDGPPPGECR
jgi:XTP/dITP diphosphohydrolase